MRQSFDLTPVAAGGVVDAAAAPLGLLRADGPHPRVALLGPGRASVSLAPGAYRVEVIVRAEGAAAPKLVCTMADNTTRTVALTPEGGDTWRGDMVFSRTVKELALALDGVSGAFVVARCRVETETPAPMQSLSAALREVARALYRKAPRWARSGIAQAVARMRSSAHRRAAAAATDAASQAGEIRVGAGDGDAELNARRADFDARFALARGLDESPAPIEAAATPDHDARVVAFYLPQFHRIAENDRWWGEGFTEWTNVSKAAAQFVGHHQPRLPGELGFYDLTAPETLARQVALARGHGVSAFCFHYYWFAGKRLLERPLDAFVADRSLDLGFTLCWANENWTRRWDGAEDAVLIAQEHSLQDHARVFDDMARYLEDPRALRIGDQPLVLVYRPAIIDDARAMTEIWRERAAARGWPGIFIAATDAFQFDDPQSLGFDALVEFPPHGLTPEPIGARLAWLNPRHGGVVFDYAQTAAEAVARLAKRRTKAFAHFPGVMPGWDNEARRPGAGTIFHDATPQAYARWLEAASACAARTLPADRRLVFVNAWNEWAEGAYLEPDRKWGRAFLQATSAVAGRLK